MKNDSRLIIVENPKITADHQEIVIAVKEILEGVQICYDNLDEKTDVGREIAQRLQRTIKAVDTIRAAALDMKLASDFDHSTLVQVEKELPQIKAEVRDLQTRLGRQSKRHVEHEKNNELSRRYAGVKW